MSSWLAFDLETVAHPDAEQYVEPVRAPRNYSNPDKIAAYEAEKYAEQISRAALSPDLCRIVAVGYAESDWNDQQPVVAVCKTEEEEAQVLRLLVSKMDLHTQVIGFNCIGFDLPVLIRRCQLLGVDAPPIELNKYRPGRVLDLMQMLSFQGTIPARSLKFYAKRFGLPVRDTLAGSDVEGLWLAQEYDLIAAHCASDVALTLGLARRLGVIAPVGAVEDASVPF